MTSNRMLCPKCADHFEMEKKEGTKLQCPRCNFTTHATSAEEFNKRWWSDDRGLSWSDI